MCTENIYETVIGILKSRFKGHEQAEAAKILDLGCGSGALLEEVAENMGSLELHGCDFTKYTTNPAIEFKQSDFDKALLPYEDNSFDIVTSTEVVEHIEDFRALLREAQRVLKPEGLLVISTPNVLNLKSQLKYLFCGFYNLFGPLSFSNDDKYGTGQHISPISYFYLAHALVAAGFNKLELAIDKKQKTSVFYALFLYPFLWLYKPVFLASEKKQGTLTKENNPQVMKHFSSQVLLGRTIVISAFKAD